MSPNITEIVAAFPPTPIFLTFQPFLEFNMVCRNLCENLYSKIIFGKSHYEGGKKYCRRCKIYFSYDGVFYPSASRMSPTSKLDKERLRQIQLRREEQDRIIRIIKGIKKCPVNQRKSN
jgi:hypothetical protein